MTDWGDYFGNRKPYQVGVIKLKKEDIQPGYEKVHSPDFGENERYAESLDRALTSGLDENDDVILEKEEKS